MLDTVDPRMVFIESPSHIIESGIFLARALINSRYKPKYRFVIKSCKCQITGIPRLIELIPIAIWLNKPFVITNLGFCFIRITLKILIFKKILNMLMLIANGFGILIRSLIKEKLDDL